MINVSNEWKAAQYERLQPETFVEITSVVTEPGLQEDAVSFCEDETYFSEAERVVLPKAESEAYASLEYGQWGLGGDLSYFDESPENPRYVSESISDADGYFETRPIITIRFSELHIELIPGITITWSDAFGGWATDFKVTAYNSSGIVAQTTVTGNKDITSIIWLDLIDYSRIEIEIIRWSLPHHRARCSYVRLGAERTYTKDDLLGFEHRQSVDLLSAELPINSVTFSLRNDKNQWNPDSPTNIEKYLLEEQKVTVRYGMDVGGKREWIPGGVFWLSEWSTPSNGLEASFVANDVFSFMIDVFTGTFEGTLYDLAVEALERARYTAPGRDELKYIVHDDLKLIEAAPILEDSGYTIAQVLQLVAHAGRCVLYQDREGVIHIEPRNVVYSDYRIEPDISYTHPEYTIGKPLRAVSVTYGDDNTLKVDVGTRGEIQTIENPLIASEVDALAVAETAKTVLVNRKVISGEYRSDLRLDALDNIFVVSKYAANVISVTEVSYSTTGGGFKGTYVGRVGSVTLEESKRYSGEFYLNEI